MMMNAVNAAIETTNMTVESVLSEIATALRRSTQGVLDAARCIVQFKGHNEFPILEKKLIAEKVMAKSTISQYMTIGKCTVLARNVDKLPPSFNSIYHLAKIEAKQKGFIENAVQSGKLDRTTKLEEIRKWGETKPSEWVAITIEIPAHVSNEMREKIKAAAIKAAENLGASVKPVKVAATKEVK